MPVYLIVEVEGVNVPVFTNGVPLPERVMVLLDPSRAAPVLIVRMPPTAVVPESDFTLAPEMVRLE